MTDKRTEPQIPEAYLLIIKFLDAIGVKNLNSIEGCLTKKVDDDWSITFNPHSVPTKCNGQSEYRVPAYSATISHRDFPLGVLGITGGAICGEGAEADFIQAIRSAIDSINGPTESNHDR